ncbi:hypothetical protein GZ77_23795 [Endozoicomonas montiporae]|uniref:Uncharacterized protein n=2 Tax=Endozoicomonas montiporae TaxID=1027273 RepID=A0A081MZC9_9GAMM|nr:hypothetical protein GZ77_23795 [Endozoicomonas montiporae]
MTGKLGHHTVRRSREQILEGFTFSGKGVLKEACHSAWIGARKVGKTGMQLGAIGGAIMGLTTAIVATIGFPPSLLAMGVSTAIGAAKGGLIGGAIGFALGGIYNGIKTALYLTLKSPEKRLRCEAKSSRKELETLRKRHRSGLEQLKGKDLERLEYLENHVPFWEGLVVELEHLDAEKNSPRPKDEKASLSPPYMEATDVWKPHFIPSSQY